MALLTMNINKIKNDCFWVIGLSSRIEIMIHVRLLGRLETKVNPNHR